MSPRPPVLRRDKEGPALYGDWHGIQPLSPQDQERTFAYEDEWVQRFRALRADPAIQGAIKAGLLRLERSMAIETGVIEGLYDPTHGVTQTLIRKGFRAEHVRREGVDVEPEHLVTVLQDHWDAAALVYGHIREDRPITKHALRELHALITAHQATHTAIDMLGRRTQRPLRRGVWKDFPNNPTRPDGTVHLYAPPEQVDSQLDRMLEYYATYEQTQHPLLTGAWLHHRFIQIHPFADGNGRTGRVLLNWHLLRNGWHPVNVHRQDRGAYLYGMQQADAGNLSVLIDFLIAMARKAVSMVMADFDVDERMRVLGPDDPNYVYRKEDGWRNGV